jgi:hypothetical protein
VILEGKTASVRLDRGRGTRRDVLPGLEPAVEIVLWRNALSLALLSQRPASDDGGIILLVMIGVVVLLDAGHSVREGGSEVYESKRWREFLSSGVRLFSCQGEVQVRRASEGSSAFVTPGWHCKAPKLTHGAKRSKPG